VWLHAFCDVGETGVGIPNSKLRHGAHLASDPAGQDLPSLLFAKSGSWKVAFVDKRNDIDDDLMLIENGIHNDWNDGSKIGLPPYFNQDYYKSTSLKDSTSLKLAYSPVVFSINLRATWHNVSVAFLNRILNIHREVT